MATKIPVEATILASIPAQQRDDLARLFDGFKGDPAPVVRILQAAISRSVDKAAVAGRKHVGAKVNLKYGTLIKSIKPLKPTYRDLSGAVRFLNFNVPMTAIKGLRAPTKLPSRASNNLPNGAVALGREGPLEKQPNRVFWAKMPQMSRAGIFIRTTKNRLPIKRAYIGSPRKQFEGDGELRDVVNTTINNVLESNISSQISRMLAGKFPKK